MDIFFHPIWVHFPVAALVLAGLAWLTSYVAEPSFLWKAGSWLMVSGLVGLIMAIITGRMAESKLIHTNQIHEQVILHERLGYVSLWLFGMLGIWLWLRTHRMARLEKAGFLLLYWVGVGVMAFGAHQGGELVYQKGAGVSPYQPYLEEIFQQEQAQSLEDNLKK